MIFPHIRNAGILDAVAQLLIQNDAFLRQDFSGIGIRYGFGQRQSHDPIAQRQLFVEFVASDMRQVVALVVIQHGIQQAL